MSFKGSKAFKRCSVKSIEFTRYIKDVSSWHVTTEAERDPEKVYSLHGYKAVLNCPRTEDDNIEIRSTANNHETQSEALTDVRLLAGRMLCDTCIYSDSSKLDVTKQRAAQAAADAELIQAQALRAKAIQELIEIDPSYKGLQ